MSTNLAIRKKAKEDSDLLRLNIDSKKKLFVTIPIPPSVNDMYITTRYGGKKLNKKAERYVVVAQSRINEAVRAQNWQITEEGMWLYADMTFFMPDRIIRDASNCLKLGMDVFQGIVYKNDYYALPRIQGMELDQDNPRLEVCISLQTNEQREKAIYITRNPK